MNHCIRKMSPSEVHYRSCVFVWGKNQSLSVNTCRKVTFKNVHVRPQNSQIVLKI